MGFTGVIGHEFVGVVESVSKNDRGIKPHQRVVGEINLACLHCDVCAKKESIECRNHCPNRTVLGILHKDGCYAEYITLPVRNLFHVPDSVTDQQACFVEPLAAACRIIEQKLIQPQQRVAVIGDGKLGLLITEILAAQDCSEVVLFGRHEEKLALAPKNVTTQHVPNDATMPEFSDTFDVCVEASGSPQGLILAGEITRSLGTIVLKTTCATGTAGFNMAQFVIKELRVVGSRCGPFQTAIDLLKKGQVNVNKFLTKAYPFSECYEAIEHAKKKGTLKIQLIMKD